MTEEQEEQVWSTDYTSHGIVLEEDHEMPGCNMEGCKGHEIKVKWDDGVETTECSAALNFNNHAVVGGAL